MTPNIADSKKVAAALALLLSGLVVVMAQPALGHPSGTVKTKNLISCLHVRSDSRSSSAELGCIPGNTQVRTTGKRRGNWVQVKYQGKVGWVFKRYVRDQRAPASLATPVATAKAAETTGEQPADTIPSSQIPVDAPSDSVAPPADTSTDGKIGDLYSRSAEQACAFLKDSVMNRNCLSLFKRINFIDRNAIRYTLAYLEANGDGLQDKSCAHKSDKKAGLPSKIKNKCSFVINDLERSFAGFQFKSQAIYVDLCAKKVDDVVRSFGAKKGTGKKYLDVDGQKSTVAGAFITDDTTRSFQPYKMNKKYRALKKSLGGRIPALDLTPLHSTNNDSLDDKLLHVSPYNSSHGCPALDSKDADILSKLANQGPSLWINYGVKSMHPTESIYKCDAVAERSTRSVKAINGLRVQARADEAKSGAGEETAE